MTPSDRAAELERADAALLAGRSGDQRAGVDVSTGGPVDLAVLRASFPGF
jgi:hypothetical protein